MSMKSRTLLLLVLSALLLAACTGDAELSTTSTLVTSATNAPVTSTTAPPESGDDSPPTTVLVGESVSEFEVVAETPNDDGVYQLIVIPEGAYTDVDLQNFVIDLLESNLDLYGAEIFDSSEAAEAFQVEEADRTDAHDALLERHHFVSLIGRDAIEFRGPFSDFSGGAIGS